MSTSQRRLVLASASIAGLLALSACATGPGGSPAPTSTTVSSDQLLETAQPGLPSGRVIATGTVLDVGGDVQLCLGAVAESYPPQCSGIPLDDWTWDGVDGSETSGDVTWGTYAVYGTFDGDRYTNTDPPIMLALYDPIRLDDPVGGVDGKTDEAELTKIQDDIASRLGADALTVWTERGYVWLQVAWDDGTIQDAANAEFGDDVVVVTSAMREID
ncbi:MAG: hypothetical protein P0Y60_11850 [Candidatus Microbacterium colombiense]|nr:MAG: hypothetical protein P0Y60_11850 [Microbacterium sp.]